jgi:hypothetical protein
MLTDQVTFIEINGKKYHSYHGSPFDRGAADSYYGRARDPHWWPNGTYKGTRLEKDEMSSDQIDAYNAGYDDNEEFGSKKDWG